MTVTKDTKIFDILQESRETAPFFLEMGMHCLGCPSARNETLGQACACLLSTSDAADDLQC